ncbi:hypothetical protein XU18_3830 [Perkinsela sp. CCAP 1560/4]|nr:hypothetical protein XU18_3830 [Perkinsela sp. CCAP 1560/4]|eukprot:KNH05055.1 hypothetical protein XU18_3830 [Perkinsela sp. CCAP 1560/4]
MSDEYVPVSIDDCLPEELSAVPPNLNDTFENPTAVRVGNASTEYIPKETLPRPVRPLQKVYQTLPIQQDRKFDNLPEQKIDPEFSKEYMPATSLPRPIRSRQFPLSRAQINAAFEDPWRHLSSANHRAES